MLSTLNVSAQVALPEWVRARGLAVFVTVYSGAITLGSAFWGQLADEVQKLVRVEPKVTHFVAARPGPGIRGLPS